jgi:hypothetical protein
VQNFLNFVNGNTSEGISVSTCCGFGFEKRVEDGFFGGVDGGSE